MQLVNRSGTHDRSHLRSHLKRYFSLVCDFRVLNLKNIKSLFFQFCLTSSSTDSYLKAGESSKTWKKSAKVLERLWTALKLSSPVFPVGGKVLEGIISSKAFSEQFPGVEDLPTRIGMKTTNAHPISSIRYKVKVIAWKGPKQPTNNNSWNNNFENLLIKIKD